jgi:hypothetical protein
MRIDRRGSVTAGPLKTRPSCDRFGLDRGARLCPLAKRVINPAVPNPAQPTPTGSFPALPNPALPSAAQPNPSQPTLLPFHGTCGMGSSRAYGMNPLEADAP